jgi:gliding motility-associated-like protein
MTIRTLILLIAFSSFQSSFGQVGKDGAVTISSSSTINEYTTLNVDASSGTTSLSVLSSNLNANSRFAGNLQAGDLILIYQAQGATLSTTYNQQDWGGVSAYNNAGNYEFCDVTDVPNSTTIALRCGLKNSYSASGNVQVIRVPRYTSLAINNSITADAWNGTLGGIVVIESEGNITFASSGNINVSQLGFRGGIEDYASSTNGFWGLASANNSDGGLKGESIYGYDNDYTALGGKYGYGAPANAGGGANNHNAGGGGGANGGDPTNWNVGIGVPNPTYNSIWNLEPSPIGGLTSTGGGRGGYTLSTSNGNPQTEGPNNYADWSGDGRRILGGLGGRPLDYSTGKIFFGGGGGSGDVNDAQTIGGHGGNSGGIVIVRCYGNVTGTGNINANGEDGEDTYSTNPPTTSFAGNDGAGGGGAGGTVLIEAVGTISGISISVNGGNGGDQVLSAGNFYFGNLTEAEGPGGGAGGGYVNLSNTIPGISTTGGTNGVTNSQAMSSFPPNGATSGSAGSSLNTLSLFSITANNDTICSGSSTTLTAAVIGSLPAGSNLVWYDGLSNGNFIGAGTNFTTGNLSNDTTFYVGVCPGSVIIPISVIMGVSFSFDTTNITIIDENCSQSDGSLSGITILGGALPLTYLWNNVVAANQDLTNVASGNYTLIVSDVNGCSANLGTFSIGENTGPVIDDSNLILTDESCGQQNGSISGITATGAGLTYSWNGGTAASNPDLVNLAANDYSVLVEDGFGCTATSSIYTINNLGGPTIDATGLSIVAESCGQGDGSITGLVVTGTPTLAYSWSNGNSSIDNLNINTGTYNLTATDGNGCADSIINLFVPQNGFPTAGFTIQDSPGIQGDTIYFVDNSSADVVSWNYTFGDGNSSTDSSDFNIYENRGNYIVCLIVENQFGCQDSICETLIIDPAELQLPLPNIITPNGDGSNDLFTIEGMTEDYRILIKNRWGATVFSADKYQNNWNGRNAGGELLPAGTYYYIIVSEKLERDYTGHVMLIR